MAKDDDDLTAKPGEDPYELDWPDEDKDARAQQRANESALNEKAPVGRALASLVLGVLIVHLFVLAVTVASGGVSFFIEIAAPIAIGGAVVAWPVGLVLDRVVRNLRPGVGETAFAILGGAIGYGLTFGGLTVLQGQFDDLGQFTTFRSQASIYMMTATATSLLVTYMYVDKLRRYPKQVAILGAFVGLMVVMSLATIIFGGLG